MLNRKLTVQNRRRLHVGARVWFVTGIAQHTVGRTRIKYRIRSSILRSTSYYLETPAVPWDAYYGVEIFLSKALAYRQVAERRRWLLNARDYISETDNRFLPRMLKQNVIEKHRQRRDLVLWKYGLIRRYRTLHKYGSTHWLTFGLKVLNLRKYK